MWRGLTTATAVVVIGSAVIAFPSAAATDDEPDQVSLADDVVSVDGREYVLTGPSWPVKNLTYGYDNHSSDLGVTGTRTAIDAAFDTWEAASGLRFTSVPDCGLPFNDPDCTVPDLRIRFGYGDHGDGSAFPDFDGPGGVFAHAYPPPTPGLNATLFGDVHFDEAETWTNTGGGVDLQSIATHEIGHALGLAHTQNSRCPIPPPAGTVRPIMCTVLYGTQRTLAQDDVNAIRSLYGPPLPEELIVDIQAPPTVPVGPDATIPIVITNGLETAVSDVDLDVIGADQCDDPTIGSIAPYESVTSPCVIPTAGQLPPFTTGVPLQLEAHVTAVGSPAVSDGPVHFAIAAPDNPFSDVPAWVKLAVDWIAHFDVARGYPNNTYRPNNAITRAQVTNMVYNLDGAPDVSQYPAHPFQDVPLWVLDAVTWAVYDPDGAGPMNPLMSGFPDITFRPNDSITRGAIVRLLYRLAGEPDVSQLPPHGLTDVGAWVDDAVTWAVHDPDGAGPLKAVMAGYPNSTFKERAAITRAQVTRALYRFAAILGL